eukprot:5413545-Pyramimonas_sp.AAC.1
MPKWIQQAALEVPENDPEVKALWLHGAFRHPGDWAPKPAISPDGVTVDWYADLLPGPARPCSPPSMVPRGGVWGHIFMDGS